MDDSRRSLTTRASIRRGVTICLAMSACTLLVTGTAAAQPAEPPKRSPAVLVHWNEVAERTLAGDPTKAQPGNIYLMGVLHAAVYDAVVGIGGRYEPYAFRARAPRGASIDAAVAAAAHGFLVRYAPYATANLDTELAATLARIPDGPAERDGIAYGKKVVDHLIAARADDGYQAPILFTKAPAPGVWRPTPPAFAPMVDPWLGFVRPLLVKSATQFAPGPPPALSSAQYTRELNEVKARGSKTSTVRTPEETSSALFFSGSLLFQWNAMLRDQTAIRDLDVIDAARMFAAVDMSQADSYITVWKAKYDHGFWRPVTAIHQADTDGNPDTVADPAWEPLVTTPAYPEWTSGYNALTAVSTGGIEKLFGPNRFTMNLASSAAPGTIRRFDSGGAVRAEVVEARILQGIHYRSADEASRDLGLALVHWALNHNFRPVRRGC
jgi:hypothetical protein